MDISWLDILLRLGFATLAGMAIGLNRDLRNKPVGMRTLGLVSLGSALVVLSCTGYGSLHYEQDAVSRVIQGILTGIGFLGAGVIFVRRNIISGLTTAASVWVTAAVGMACGAGMPVLAALTVALYLLAVTLLTALIRRLPSQQRSEVYRVRYTDGRGVLRDILQAATDAGYGMALSETRRDRTHDGYVVDAKIEFTHGKQRPPESIFRKLSELNGVIEVTAEHQDHD